MPLRIAFDLDGVLADLDGELVRHAATLFGGSVAQFHPEIPAAAGPTDPPNGPDRSNLALTSQQFRQLWRHVARVENFWETLRELEPGMIRRLHAVAAERGWEVLFVTKRPPTAGDTSQLQTQRWLAANGFQLPSVFVVQKSRGRVAAALELDFVVDDRPENCLDVALESTARAILIWRDDVERLPASARGAEIGVVRSVRECLAALASIDRPVAEKPSMMSRVMQLLGFKEAAGS
jgi:hypothetical protein